MSIIAVAVIIILPICTFFNIPRIPQVSYPLFFLADFSSGSLPLVCFASQVRLPPGRVPERHGPLHAGRVESFQGVRYRARQDQRRQSVRRGKVPTRGERFERFQWKCAARGKLMHPPVTAGVLGVLPLKARLRYKPIDSDPSENSFGPEHWS